MKIIIFWTSWIALSYLPFSIGSVGKSLLMQKLLIAFSIEKHIWVSKEVSIQDFTVIIQDFLYFVYPVSLHIGSLQFSYAYKVYKRLLHIEFNRVKSLNVWYFKTIYPIELSFTALM